MSDTRKTEINRFKVAVFTRHHSFFRKDFQMLVTVIKVEIQFPHRALGHTQQNIPKLIEPRHEKTVFLHMRKQRRRSASR